MNVQSSLRALRQYIVLLVSLTLIGLSAGVLYGLTAPVRYSTTAEVLVIGQAQSVEGAATTAELNLARSYALQAVGSYVAIIPSSIVLQPVIDELGLPETTAALADLVSVSAAPGSTTISISVTDGKPGRAARIANAVADSFATVVAEQLERPSDTRRSIVRIDMIQPAVVPTAPSAPNRTVALIGGGLLGLAAGIVIIVLRTVLDARVRTIEDAAEATGAPVLGTTTFDASAGTQPLVVSGGATGSRPESYRSLRTSVQFLSPAGETPSYVVTSAGPGEGKSTTVANLALAFAETGATVALIDADLRLPRIADYFGIEGGVGLTEVLAGRLAVTDALQRWGRGTLFVLPSGTVPPNPAELLGSSEMAGLLADLREAFDIILIDAPPVVLVTDAAVVARRTSGAILVTAAGKSVIPRVRDAVTNIENVGAKVLGTVVTMMPARGPDKTLVGAYGYGDGAR
ncbi:polysaccharide biosynthesis tyrosine autokinase [Microbacterium sp. LWO12-1.2]|uniref:polysaccharide biosynthesis tyrosine autokinase n=1 Tax=Microbacterium sp. LWO12-1.2 TaxID=3135261 RepID=UPI003413340E